MKTIKCMIILCLCAIINTKAGKLVPINAIFENEKFIICFTDQAEDLYDKPIKIEKIKSFEKMIETIQSYKNRLMEIIIASPSTELRMSCYIPENLNITGKGVNVKLPMTLNIIEITKAPIIKQDREESMPEINTKAGKFVPINAIFEKEKFIICFTDQAEDLYDKPIKIGKIESFEEMIGIMQAYKNRIMEVIIASPSTEFHIYGHIPSDLNMAGKGVSVELFMTLDIIKSSEAPIIKQDRGETTTVINTKVGKYVLIEVKLEKGKLIGSKESKNLQYINEKLYLVIEIERIKLFKEMIEIMQRHRNAVMRMEILYDILTEIYMRCAISQNLLLVLWYKDNIVEEDGIFYVKMDGKKLKLPMTKITKAPIIKQDRKIWLNDYISVQFVGGENLPDESFQKHRLKVLREVKNILLRTKGCELMDLIVEINSLKENGTKNELIDLLVKIVRCVKGMKPLEKLKFIERLNVFTDIVEIKKDDEALINLLIKIVQCVNGMKSLEESEFIEWLNGFIEKAILDEYKELIENFVTILKLPFYQESKNINDLKQKLTELYLRAILEERRAEVQQWIAAGYIVDADDASKNGDDTSESSSDEVSNDSVNLQKDLLKQKIQENEELKRELKKLNEELKTVNIQIQKLKKALREKISECAKILEQIVFFDESLDVTSESSSDEVDTSRSSGYAKCVNY